LVGIKKALALFLVVLLSVIWFFPELKPQTVLASGPVLIHQFDFEGSLEDARGTGVSLQVHANTATHGFGAGEWWWTATGSPGGGLILDTDLLANPQNYSLGFRISYNQVAPRWKKILSFKGTSDDNGLYFYDGYLQFYPFGSNNQITYTVGTFYDFIFTRGTDNVMRVYIVQGDGSITKVYERNDPSGATVPIQVGGKYRFMFFMDDTATSGEWTNGGAVRSIRLWDGVLSESEVGGALSDVVTGNATNITTDSAVLTGNVNPNGLETQVWFEYGVHDKIVNFFKPLTICASSGMLLTAEYAVRKEGYHGRSIGY
jgi:hypothetical protein